MPRHTLSRRASWLLTLLPAACAVLLPCARSLAAPVINEIVASSTVGFADEDGDQPDWIEVYNPDAAPVSLNGWSLTDDAAVTDKWVFPDVTVAPGAYLVVFASDKDRRPTDGGNLHTNFKLTADGEYLGLYDDGAPRQVISDFSPSFPRQRSDIAYGRLSGGALAYLDPPTPLASNDSSTSYDGFLDPPVLSVDHGFFDAPFDVTLTHGDPGAEIRYSLDGSVPTQAVGQVFVDPIAIEPLPDRGAVMLRAAAFRAGFLSSDAVTASYIFLDGVLTQADRLAGLPAQWGAVWPNVRDGDYEMDPRVVDYFYERDYVIDGMVDVPTLSIVMHHDDLWSSARGIYMNPALSGAAWERAASVELILPDGSQGFQKDCGIEVQGGSSTDQWKTAKLSFDLEFNGDFGPAILNYPFFPGSSVEDFEVMTLDAHIDLTWVHYGDNHRQLAQYVRDAFASDLQRGMGHASTRSRFCNVYLNGLYWGVYDVHEKPTSYFAASYFGGAPSDYDVVKHQGSEVVDGDNVAWNEMMAVVRAGVADLASYEQLAALVDMPSFIDYMLMNIYVGNTDWPYHNWYAARQREAGAKWRFVSWDAEHGLEGVNVNWVVPIHDVTDTPGEIFAAVRANPEFNLLFADRAHKHFSPGGVLYVDSSSPQYDPANPERNRPAALYMQRIAEIDSAISCESARWGDNRRIANPYTRNIEWSNERDRILTQYFPQRSNIVLNQLKAAGLYTTTPAPAYNQHGGEVEQGFAVTMTLPPGAAGTIYYTLDGSDPREYGTGAVLPAAQIYTGPIVITGPRLFKARTLDGASWSALAEAQFVVVLPPGDLVISEIMYSPTGGTDFEFIELLNTTDHVIELSGLSLTNGITYTFPLGTFANAGEFIVIAGNPAMFASRYPGVSAAGPYDGNLSNGGEDVTLIDAIGNVVTSVGYDDEGFWPIAPDGFGWSLIFNNVGGDPQDGSNWRASANVNGSPGVADPAPAVGGIVVNEVLYNAAAPLEDAIELHNPTAGPIDVGGWYLSDTRTSVTTLKKFRIPNGTVLAAGGYAVYYDYQFNTGGTAFGLSSAGEAVYLSSATGAGTLTGYITETPFGASEPGVSFGRYQTSLGIRNTFQSARSFGMDNPATVQEFRTGTGAANAGPLIGPVVINELMYAPVAGGDAFLELRNRGAAAVPLYNTGALRGWQIAGLNNVAGGGDFEFPPGAEVPAYGFALVVAIDPAVFRDAHGVPADVPIFGPYGGVLDVDGERLKLVKATGAAPGSLAFVLTDEVRYGIDVPWPASPAGGGPSLERVFGNEYGDDPVNWSASLINGGTPGTCNTVSLHFGDGDDDGDIDDDDLAAFVDCETGPGGGPYPPACEPFDFELDGDVDDDDESVLLAAYNPAGSLPADVNGDGTVSLADYDVFEECFSASGPDVPAAPGVCVNEFDFDDDGDVDLADAAEFQTWFGQSRPYNPATCHAAR